MGGSGPLQHGGSDTHVSRWCPHYVARRGLPGLRSALPGDNQASLPTFTPLPLVGPGAASRGRWNGRDTPLEALCPSS